MHGHVVQRSAQMGQPALPVVVVLAAGSGSRFGGRGHKLEQALGESSVLAVTLSRVVATGLPLVVVTTAAMVPQARAVVATRDIVLLPPVGSVTREPLGIGYSIATGVAARAQAGGWLVLPADMPLVQPATLRRVAEGLQQHPVAYAQHQGRRGHPVGFHRELYSELVMLGGDDGARRLVARYPSHPVEVDDHGALLGIDTEADLQRVRAAWQGSLSQI